LLAGAFALDYYAQLRYMLRYARRKTLVIRYRNNVILYHGHWLAITGCRREQCYATLAVNSVTGGMSPYVGIRPSRAAFLSAAVIITPCFLPRGCHDAATASVIYVTPRYAPYDNDEQATYVLRFDASLLAP